MDMNNDITAFGRVVNINIAAVLSNNSSNGYTFNKNEWIKTLSITDRKKYDEILPQYANANQSIIITP